MLYRVWASPAGGNSGGSRRDEIPRSGSNSETSLLDDDEVVLCAEPDQLISKNSTILTELVAQERTVECEGSVFFVPVRRRDAAELW